MHTPRGYTYIKETKYPTRVCTRKGFAMTTTEFEVTGMTCGHCELSIREEVQEIPGVEAIEVSHRTGTLAVTSNKPLGQGAVVAAVEAAGYRAVQAG